MIDWLRKENQEPHIALGEAVLPIAVKRHARATRMTLRLSPDGSEVRVTLPRWGRTAEAIAFAQSRQDWLETQLSKIPKTIEIGPGSVIQFRGLDLKICWQEGLPRRPIMAAGVLSLGGPLASLQSRVQRWLEAQAIEIMQEDLNEYCHRAAVTAPSIKLSRAQRRWGSCSGDGSIRVNWRLIQAPDDVRRSVIAHEVTHLVHFDHSSAFYRMLGEIYGDGLQMADRWLKMNGRTLYAAFG